MTTNALVSHSEFWIRFPVGETLKWAFPAAWTSFGGVGEKSEARGRNFQTIAVPASGPLLGKWVDWKWDGRELGNRPQEPQQRDGGLAIGFLHTAIPRAGDFGVACPSP
jgi:hypothetical protein